MKFKIYLIKLKTGEKKITGLIKTTTDRLGDLLALSLVDSGAHFLGPVLHLLPGHLLALLPGHRHTVLTGHLPLHGVLHSGALLLVHVASHGAVLGGAVLLVGGVAVLAGHLLAVLPKKGTIEIYARHL